MDIELCIYYNIVTIWFLFIIQSINFPPSAHTTAAITYSVHILQQPLHIQCTHYSSHYIFSAHTTAAITSSMHTATMYSHVQLSAANIKCTLQLYYLMLIPYSASSEEG